MKILYFSDIVGKPGRRAIREYLEQNKDEINPDLIIANLDNVSSGKGPTHKTYEEIDALGVDVMTCGDHIWDYTESADILTERNSKLLRPYNYPEICPGKGLIEIEVKGIKVAVVSMLGRVWTKEGLESPFVKTDEVINNTKAKIIIIDFHAEATSEKNAYVQDFAGKVSAIIGSHTHVQTADARILKEHTGYITDAGFCGPKDSVIGSVAEQSIKIFRTGIKTYLDVAKGETQINAVILEIDEKTGKAIKIDAINV